MELQRWNDDRLDDLHHWLEATAKRTDNIGMITASHELQLGEINRERGRRTEQRWAVVIVVITVTLGQLAGFIGQIVHSNPKPTPVVVRIQK